MKSFEPFLQTLNQSSSLDLMDSFFNFVEESQKEHNISQFNGVIYQYTNLVTKKLKTNIHTTEEKIHICHILLLKFIQNQHFFENSSKALILQYIIDNKLFYDLIKNVSKPLAYQYIKQEISQYKNLKQILKFDLDFSSFDIFHPSNLSETQNTLSNLKSSLNFYELTILKALTSKKSSINHYLTLMYEFNKKSYPLDLNNIIQKPTLDQINYSKYKQMPKYIQEILSNKRFSFEINKENFYLSIKDYVYFKHISSNLYYLLQQGTSYVAEFRQVSISSTNAIYDIYDNAVQTNPNIEKPLQAFFQEKIKRANKNQSIMFWLRLSTPRPTNEKIKLNKI